MDLKLDGKVVVITGGATGIGKECAWAYAKEGCKVAICSRSKEKLDEIKKEFLNKRLPIYVEQVDVSNIKSLKRFAHNVEEFFGQLDIWINNAGVNKIKPMIEYEEYEWDHIISINLKAVFFGCKIAAESMKENGGGVIINVSSYGAIIPVAGKGAYAASKSAVLSLTKTYAAELASCNIRVVAFVPGVIKTEMSKASIEIYKDKLRKDIALNRIGNPSDIARIIVFISSDSASYITGTHIEVSGGKLCVQNPDYSW